MTGLTTALLGRACRVFLTLAYPEGAHTIPPAKAVYLNVAEGQELDALLGQPICQPISSDGRVRGYAFRLGSGTYPHLKLQVVDCDQTGTLVFAVDTHDGLRFDLSAADAERWARIQAANRRLKEQIERGWETEGLMTFKGLLRRDLGEECRPVISQRGCPPDAISGHPE
jgi:hypothetical protein